MLSEKIANQIAAGEVVNRPASVVKEMMENSIDAGATEVIVNYKDAGQGLIQIVDNGDGMSPNDARMAFDRHATSKIRSAEDIYNLHTFGFRGEALASIAAVAQVELKTRHREAEFGTHTVIHGGQFVDQTRIPCDFGSQFFVRNLFYNIPARRKFIEKDSRSASNIKMEFKRVALCNPQVGFELFADDSPLYRLQPATLANRIVDLIGSSMRTNLLEVSVDTTIVKVSGFIGRPKSAKRSATDQFFFVNSRFFKSKHLNRAVMSAYDKIIAYGTNPAYFLFLEIDPDRIDVNVHPQKTEVKFVEESAIWQIVNAAVRESLAKTGAIPMMEFDNECDVEIPVLRSGERYAEPAAASNSSYNPFTVGTADQMWESGLGTKIEYLDSGSREDAYDQYESQIDIESYYRSQASQISHGTQNLQSLHNDFEELSDIIFTVDHYGWCRIGQDMLAIDLRRAKERILYDHYINTLNIGETSIQRILFPIEITLSNSEFSLLQENIAEFLSLGFELNIVEEQSKIEVSGLPADIKSEDAELLIREILTVLTTPQSVEDQRRDKLARTMARSGAFSVSSSVGKEQAQQIVEQLMQGGNAGHTPSGKAIMWQITRNEIKRNLDR